MKDFASMTLDPATFVFFLALFGLSMGAISFSTSKSISANIRGLKDWGRCMLCLGVGFALYFLRNNAPDFLTMLVANFIILGAPVYALVAHSKFFNLPVPKNFMVIAIILGVIGNVLSYYSISNIGVGISLATALLFGAVLYQLVRYSDWKNDKSVWLAIFAISLLVILLTVRIFAVSLGSGASAKLYSQSGMQLGLFLLISFSIVFTSMSFILMVHNRQKNEIFDSSRRDGLTGLYSRKAFFNSAEEIDKKNPPESYAVLMVDIDFFKKINDTYGHAAGDVAIIQLARLLAKHVRATDVVGRYGGEEFCIVLRNCAVSHTENFAKELVAIAAAQKIMISKDKEIGFTISVGYTQRKVIKGETPLNIAELLEKADQGLYEAKRTGRNQAIANW